MISLHIKSYCHNCPEFEPDVQKEIHYLEGTNIERYVKTDIYCEHRIRCKKMVDYLKEALSKKGENND